MNKAPPQSLLEAVSLHERGAILEAAARYSAILGREPRNIDALFFLGVACGQQGRFDESVRLLRKVVKMAPKHARAHMFLGLAQAERGDHDHALKSLDRAIAQQPSLPEAHIHRGNVFAAREDYAPAIENFDRALALDGTIVGAWINRGNALRAIDRFEEALQSYRRALAIKPELAEAHYSIGLTYEDLCRQDLAIASFDRAIALNAFSGDPRRLAQVYLHRAVASNALGRFADGLADSETALRISPDDEVLYTISFIDRLHGRWLEAWPKHERRLSFRLKTPAVLAERPMWAGEPLSDALLLIKGEEGLGDQINFCRYVPYLAARGFRVAVWPDAKLAPLLKSVKGIERVVAGEEEITRLGRISWLNMLSLPHVLRTGIETIPPTTPYLAADPVRVDRWRAQLGGHSLKVGIHWQGNPSMAQDRLRSMPLAQFAPLAGLADVRLISMQRGPAARQIAEVAFGERIEQPFDPSDVGAEALLETAALIMALDLVVTSDSMVAHLGGALERPVFLALMCVPDWRWRLQGEDCPWYPTMRLFRQPRPGNWQDVFLRIAEAVRTVAEQARNVH